MKERRLVLTIMLCGLMGIFLFFGLLASVFTPLIFPHGIPLFFTLVKNLFFSGLMIVMGIVLLIEYVKLKKENMTYMVSDRFIIPYSLILAAVVGMMLSGVTGCMSTLWTHVDTIPWISPGFDKFIVFGQNDYCYDVFIVANLTYLFCKVEKVAQVNSKKARHGISIKYL